LRNLKKAFIKNLEGLTISEREVMSKYLEVQNGISEKKFL